MMSVIFSLLEQRWSKVTTYTSWLLAKKVAKGDALIDQFNGRVMYKYVRSFYSICY